MSFGAALQAGTFPVALEITPPQRPLPGVLLRRARLLGESIGAINVIQRPDRQSSLDAAIELLAAGFEPVWHLVARGRTEEELRAEMGRAAAAGIRNVLCIRGDHAGPETPGGLTVRRTIELAHELMPGAAIGATLNQYLPDVEGAFRNLLPKIRAGASYVQTQPAFGVECLAAAAARLAEAAPGTQVVAMVMPLLSAEALDRIERRLGVQVGPAVRRRVTEDGEAGAWEFFDETVARLAQCGFVQGIAIMTFEMDPPAGTGERVLAALTRAGLLR